MLVPSDDKEDDTPVMLSLEDIRIESDVQVWSRHPNPMDEHSHTIAFPLQGGPFYCTQGEGGQLTHFFAGNLHAIDLRCPIGTPLLAVGDGTIIDAKAENKLTGISVSNLFQWNSIIIELDPTENDQGPLFVEYVHIQSTCVQPGDKVTEGQVIGTSGSIGFSPEPHLHFAAYRSSEPTAATVRVKFQQKEGQPYLPKAGFWYDSSGQLDAPNGRK
jgi:murein DD-endopeptidase MepM/ murein hydrolase activator NlpD